MTDFDQINDRATWLAYRADWRRRYRLASQDVRDGRRAVREGWREAEAADDERLRRSAAELQSRLHGLRGTASRMMAELGKAKERRDALLASTPELKAA